MIMSFVLKGVQYANKTTIILSTMKTQKNNRNYSLSN